MMTFCLVSHYLMLQQNVSGTVVAKCMVSSAKASKNT